jgi:hypothetical protein
MTTFRLDCYDSFRTVMAALLLALAGCALGNGAPVGVARVYSGIEPQGDLVVVTINGSDITINNQTAATQTGPIHFSQITDPNQNNGFHNLYRTDALDSSGQFLRFALLDNIAVVYQAFDATDSAVGGPGYALFKKPFTLGDWKPAGPSIAKLFNRIEYMPPHAIPGVCCFGCEWLADNGDGTGLISGAKYDIRSAADHGYGIDPNTNLPYGLENPHSSSNPPTPASINWSDINNHIDSNTGTFQMIDDNGHLDTFVATPGGTLIGDYGANNGGTFFVPQADTPNFESMYSGTYLVFGFELAASGQTNNMKVYRITLADPGDGSGNGKIAVSDWSSGSANTCAMSPLANLPPDRRPGRSGFEGRFSNGILLRGGSGSRAKRLSLRRQFYCGRE